jgi:hypothetical protein
MSKEHLYKILRRSWDLQERLGDDLLVTIRCDFDHTKALARYQKINLITKRLERKFINS